jgi:hypothetical protein
MVQLDPGSLGPVANRLKRAQGQLTAVIRMHAHAPTRHEGRHLIRLLPARPSP